MKPVIQVENISKQYELGTTPTNLVDAFEKWWRKDSKPETFWALKDVSFDVQEGEVLGIIGRNGAGKSTLLKILSRITEPTTGRAVLRGRVASLLEVGTGFHPDLTGRENIYMNGAILGMRRWEINRKFRDIVEFSELEKFIDTPIKHYSSGMYMRLAFAIAAHLEPEILLVDEVLAVGDANFQKKSLNKMQDAGRAGRTVIFVSHNMSAVTRLCQRTLLMDEGAIVKDGLSHQVVSTYIGAGSDMPAQRDWPDLKKAPGNDCVRLQAVFIRTEDGKITDAIDIRKPVGIEMEYEVLKSDFVLIPYLTFYNQAGVYVFGSADWDPIWRKKSRPQGRYKSVVWIPGNFLSEGRLTVSVGMSTVNPDHVHFYEPDVVGFHIIDTLEGDSARGDYAGQLSGVVRPLLKWTTITPELKSKKSAL